MMASLTVSVDVRQREDGWAGSTQRRIAGHFAKPGVEEQPKGRVASSVLGTLVGIIESEDEDLAHGARVQFVDKRLSSSVGTCFGIIGSKRIIPCQESEAGLLAVVVDGVNERNSSRCWPS
jgi:hypothetical protein